MHTDDHADPSCRIKIQHGTTTLAFRFKGGVIVAVDSRASAGSYVGESKTAQVVDFEILVLLNSFWNREKGHRDQPIFAWNDGWWCWYVIMVLKRDDQLIQFATADCQYWETYLGMHCRLHELRNRERISVSAASKYLSNLVYGYKGMGLSMVRISSLVVFFRC